MSTIFKSDSFSFQMWEGLGHTEQYFGMFLALFSLLCLLGGIPGYDQELLLILPLEITLGGLEQWL